MSSNLLHTLRIGDRVCILSDAVTCAGATVVQQYGVQSGIGVVGTVDAIHFGKVALNNSWLLHV